MEDEGKVKIVEPYQLRYSDLLILSSEEGLLSSPLPEIQRLESITTSIMENLGPTGPGLLAITGVPGASSLRRSLLRFAPRLALLNSLDLKRILKENGLGSDVPLKNLDRTVSPFTMQLKYEQGVLASGRTANQLVEDHVVADRQDKSRASEFEILKNVFEVLGILMIELGCHLARVCDRVIGGHDLEHSLFESCTAKGRLIHYHSDFDNLYLQATAKRKQSTNRHSAGNSLTNAARGTDKLITIDKKSVGDNGTCCDSDESELWQQWHYDYGIFTILTEPMFLLPCFPQTSSEDDFSSVSHRELPSPSGHSYLQIYHPNKSSIFSVKVSPDSFLVQVGETADILSKGRFRATLHCVTKPAEFKDLSRENFVVFLHPTWNKTFSLSNYPVECLKSCEQKVNKCDEKSCTDQELAKLAREISKIVPPLSSRLKDGMTFAEFSKETTKQYYGGRGLQSNR